MTNNIARVLAITLVIVSAFSFAQSQSPAAILAVLEDTPGMTSDAPNYRSVRVVFWKESHQWKAYPTDCEKLSCLQSATPSLKSDMTWTVGFDGRSLGQVTSQLFERPDKTLWGQFLVESRSVPSVGKPTLEFAGWLGSPVLRPLVLNSRHLVADPDQWKPSTLSNENTAKLRLEFKRKYPVLGTCEKMGAKPYRTNDIKITKSYRSKRNWQLAQLSMKGCAPEDERGDELSTEWYVVSPGGKVNYLDSNMHLVDAGDYDNDGESELVFSIDDYNRGGYKLFYDDFKQKAVFEFRYH